MPRFQQLPKTGTHIQEMPDGTRKRCKPGTILELPHRDLLRPGENKFTELDPQPTLKPEVRFVNVLRVERRNRWYYVVNGQNGRTMNEKGLRREEAYDLAGLPMPADPDDDGEGGEENPINPSAGLQQSESPLMTAANDGAGEQAPLLDASLGAPPA
jgi:hypothetical protein